jgi:hypothetical protein
MDAGETEAEQLRRRLEALEREHVDQIARANAAVAAAQDRSYWLDRWNVDLNALMRRRGASELRALLRGARFLVRSLRAARAELPGAVGRVRRALKDPSR